MLSDHELQALAVDLVTSCPEWTLPEPKAVLSMVTVLAAMREIERVTVERCAGELRMGGRAWLICST